MPVAIPYPYFELRFNAKGEPEVAGQLDAAIAGLKDKQVTDVFMASHGWNNDPTEAHALYEELFNNVKKAEASVPVNGRIFAVIGIIWPSKRFDVADDKPNAASLGDGEARVRQQIATLRELLASEPGAEHEDSLRKAETLLPTIETNAAARRDFATIFANLLPASVGEEGGWHLDGSLADKMIKNDTLLKELGSPPVKTATQGGGAASMSFQPTATSDTTFQGSAGLGDFLKGTLAGASNLINYVLYYQMKARAGTVGRAGVNAAIRAIREQLPAVRVHLVGHSFGCRLITAAATGDAVTKQGFVNSMSLLQGAFSHYAFAESYDDTNQPGYFRDLIKSRRVSGPVIITHTRADKAVGLAYAIASRIAGQIAAAIGDKKDPYGGLGSNGTQSTNEAINGTLPRAGQAFSPPLAAGTMTNLLADGLITSHSDVRNEHAAHAVLSAAMAA